MAAETQWRIASDGRRMGLDDTAARIAARSVRADGLGDERRGRRLRWRHVFEGVRAIESAALAEAAKISGRRSR